MEQFSLFDAGHADSLQIANNGLPNSVFALTDDIKTYGELSYPRHGRRFGLIQGARQSWDLASGKGYNRDIIINDASTGTTVAMVKTSLWRARVTFELADGQIFKFIRPTVFTKRPHWENAQYGTVLTVKGNTFNIIHPIKIISQQGTFKNNDYLMLMSFISFHLILIREVTVYGVRD